MTMARVRWRVSAQQMARIGRFLLLAIFLAAFYLLYSSTTSERTSGDLEKEIARLSVYYVRALARERGLEPPPHAVDLQRSLSVLLQSMMARMKNLELFMASNNSRSINMPVEEMEAVGKTSSASVEEEQRVFNAFCSFKRLRETLRWSKDRCELPANWRTFFPECEGKLSWMERNHNIDPCYAAYGVSDTRCSFLIYLSEVENFCPRSPNIRQIPPDAQPSVHNLHVILLGAPKAVYTRARRLWPYWRQAAALAARGEVRKRVAMFRASPKPPDATETLMWADLTASLHALGHSVVWIHSLSRLQQLLNALPVRLPSTPCPARPDIFLDLLFTDEAGSEELSRRMRSNFPNLACIVRILSPDGASPLADSPPTGLLWRQFYTAYPDLDDHTFLGFAVQRGNRSNASPRRMALVLGSTPDVFAGAGPFLKAVAKHFALHTTVSDSAAHEVARHLAPHVTLVSNHRVARESDMESLMSQAALLVGLGRPLNPPIVLQALSYGLVFLNPRFDPAVSVSNRSESWTVTSQHTYVERHVGEPWSYLVDLLRPDAVEKSLEKIRNGIPYVPMDFSHEGYIRRLISLLQHDDLCSPYNSLEPQWPPAKSVEYYLAVRGDSCDATCRKRNRRCESSYFPIINSRMELEERSIHCSKLFYRSDPLFPAVDAASKACHLQSEPRRFSCFHRPSTVALQRICPCRDHKPGQLALCKDC